MSSSTGPVGFKERFIFNPKEGIDNPAMVITDDAATTPSPRLCVLKKDEGAPFGFHLLVERGRAGHIVSKVASGGVADRSGLQNGDRVLEVNGCFINDAAHSEVARKIKLSGHHLCLLTLDGDEYERVLARGQSLEELARKHEGNGREPPRLCHITRDPSTGLGIRFTPVEGNKSRFSVSLLEGGAAEKAGVHKGDLLVWINGAAASDLTPSALTRMMKKCGNHITILVIDGDSDKIYTRRKMPVLPSMAVPHNLPHRARKLRLTTDTGSFGFFLRLERTPSGRTAHTLQSTDNDSPASRAAMRSGELLLEVNGEWVETLTHEEVVECVRKSGRQVCLTTITPQGLEFYNQMGLSPLLFCDDDDDGDAPQTEPKTRKAAALHKVTGGSASPRLCTLQKGPLGFGFNLGQSPQHPGTFVSQVSEGGPGQRAGLQQGDAVLEVNGQNVENKYLEEVIMLVKKGGRSLSLLVVDNTDHGTRDSTHNEEVTRL
ncbi:NHERF family PDZ scaffold protein 4b [Synchiropus splendidus]|uniref:NHERF family PDZ scaffold protein 4b n=1 Tax=Synchiropus splendidus TaxID=270530 RepID=UPI00237E9124|nr:NHERF family PDZ scaffold protein 4b [Synchiropus splendidus]XP_053703715.1 NHERF family PDZ scaffold protein 4b [Synchiropus splendidus]